MSSAREEFWTTVQRHRKSFSNVNQMFRFTYRRRLQTNARRSSKNLEAIPMTKFQYTKLPDPGKCIRILEIQAGHFDDVIVCKLKGVTLSASVNQYEALSYVWTIPGEETAPIPIQVNDESLEIGPSLYSALQFLRSPDQSRFLWVDAICIDQSSFPERDVQVPLMYEIYRNASSTVCFLGSDNYKTGAAFKMLEELAEEGKKLGPVALNDMDTLPAFINHLPVHSIKTRLSDEHKGDSTIVDIVQRTWWYRAWTVQEVMLSSNAVIMIGHHTITWQNFCAAVDHGLNTQIWGPVVLGFIVNPVALPYISMRALMNGFRRPDRLLSPAVDLLRLLANCRHRESTDPRDKIYAVLGLLRATHSEALMMSDGGSDALDIELGYNNDVEHVYRHMCQEIIRKTDCLDVLGICPRTTLQMPSWVTDWSATERIGSPLTQDSLDRSRKTHASKGTKANARFSSDGSRLILSGFELTSIAALSETLPVPDLKNLITNRNHEARVSKFQAPNVRAWIQPWDTDVDAWIPDFQSMVATTDSRLDIFISRVKRDIAYYLVFLKLFTVVFFYLLRVFTALFLFIIFAFGKLLLFTLTSIPRNLIIQYQTSVHDCQAIMAVFHTLFAWEAFAAAAAEQQEPTNPGGLESSEVYWHTLCSGTYYRNADPAETKLAYQTWSDLLDPLRKFVTRHNRLSRAFPWIGIALYMRATWDAYGEFWPLVAAAQCRRMGRLENGWLGLLSGDARVGDVVVLARGGKVPLVVREEEVEVDGEGEREGQADGKGGEMRQQNRRRRRFVFVGEAYVHGIMDGEAWEEERCKPLEIW